jgi:hypothetical protein
MCTNRGLTASRTPRMLLAFGPGSLVAASQRLGDEDAGTAAERRTSA